MKTRSDNLYFCSELKGKPVIVGADRGIAVAMSAEAKKLGITRGMPVFKIRRKFGTNAIKRAASLGKNPSLRGLAKRKKYEYD